MWTPLGLIKSNKNMQICLSVTAYWTLGFYSWVFSTGQTFLRYAVYSDIYKTQYKCHAFHFILKCKHAWVIWYRSSWPAMFVLNDQYRDLHKWMMNIQEPETSAHGLRGTCEFTVKEQSIYVRGILFFMIYFCFCNHCFCVYSCCVIQLLFTIVSYFVLQC